jgi:hypothetical protein
MEEHSSTTTAPKAPRRGRPTCCTEENLEKILTVIREDGVSDSYVALFGNMSPATLSRWKREEPHIVFRIEQARAEFERDRRAALRNAKLKNGLPNWRAQVYLLQLACPDIYGYPPGSKAKREKRIAPPSFDQGEDAWDNLPANDQTGAPIPEPSSSAAYPHPQNSCDSSPATSDSEPKSAAQRDIYSEDVVQNLQKPPPDQPHKSDQSSSSDPTDHSRRKPIASTPNPAVQPHIYSEPPVQNLQKSPPNAPARPQQSIPSSESIPSARDLPSPKRSPDRLGPLKAAFKNLHKAMKPNPPPPPPTPAAADGSLWLRPVVNPPAWWVNPPPLQPTRDPANEYFWF